MKIGLEVHVQLPTKSKLFCPCPTTDAPAPNTHVCPVCLGLPGARPMMNGKAIEYGILLAKMLGCTIRDTTWFARKIYFYPDNAKNFQITQYDRPLGEKGMYYLNGKKPIRITRIHIEEDPGKIKRVGDLSSLVDYNRSGIPLAEIVTEPDLSTPAEAREFLGQLIRDIRHTIDIPDDGERSIRCDCNLSVGIERCEVKNVTGLRNVERALTYEMVRQTKLLKAGGKVVRETRRFDEERGVTISVRKKEMEADYGYIDEPDLGIFNVKELADSLKIKESPHNMIIRLTKEYGIDERTAKQFVSTSVDLARLFEDLAAATDAETARTWTSGAISAGWRAFEARGGKDASEAVSIVRDFTNGKITDTECGLRIKAFLTGTDVDSVNAGSADLDAMISEYLDGNPSVVEDYRKNEKAANRVIGHVMKQTGGAYSSADIVDATKKLIGERL
ncbi:MAG: Asp-tRNA(Asn)/Glu-tRNA(Gln) amidotransferase subunit GatB [Candidatus Methanomethylophilaceae archaeon]|jgi:aspartyl-tRNA(Asn)/glutamyl-tRNA(Gln) amidotransferase subunit B|nr:Asp-tRNA(Asn)/Glu-tRNA(Gln) amidotransferase subunit GatB [Candidatus Methanomethylophilaceae archaeon]NCA73688.1 Asp-tRNA(Asn)/Glu-tRNA(Gln) amidotransferase subunit GatB [Gammaproteobacteria bacterium]MDD2935777.1 Asp-tRNA(Asn)/Glu-tRNA(Gln) amidotransferase subunit GatB [Candidatus Methanomethylophilaceae archaeon]MDD3351331.1 Asp-tRNA(Asn)/Glu-tRNA(Gln) amidotransferase subunit GatB [Candidatus Methanomethylophilaceae archaeon]MDD3986703.1 Asp-tRNA(Asn)/Glu-tRNA(Gln) amidotransferase sub